MALAITYNVVFSSIVIIIIPFEDCGDELVVDAGVLVDGGETVSVAVTPT